MKEHIKKYIRHILFEQDEKKNILKNKLKDTWSI